MHSINKRLWVRLTRFCNNNCIFCLDKEAQNGSVINYNEIKKILRVGRKKHYKRVVLSGGEPTIHPNFLEIIRYSKNIGFEHIQCISNGRMFAYPNFLNEALQSGLTEITFSFHGECASLHDKLTGVNGAFEQAISGLRHAKTHKNLIVSVDVVLNKMNIKRLTEIIKFFNFFGVNEFDLLQIMPFGAAWQNRNLLFYDIGKNISHLNRAFEFAASKGIKIWTNRLPAKYLINHENLIQDPQKLHDEIKGRETELKEMLFKNRPMECYNERCDYCFLKDFCLDIIQLKLKKALHAKPLPKCITKDIKLCYFTKTPYSFKLSKKTSLKNLLEFYISKRYFIKISKCVFCKENIRCQGMPIRHALKHHSNVS